MFQTTLSKSKKVLTIEPVNDNPGKMKMSIGDSETILDDTLYTTMCVFKKERSLFGKVKAFFGMCMPVCFCAGMYDLKNKNMYNELKAIIEGAYRDDKTTALKFKNMVQDFIEDMNEEDARAKKKFEEVLFPLDKNACDLFTSDDLSIINQEIIRINICWGLMRSPYKDASSDDINKTFNVCCCFAVPEFHNPTNYLLRKILLKLWKFKKFETPEYIDHMERTAESKYSHVQI